MPGMEGHCRPQPQLHALLGPMEAPCNKEWYIEAILFAGNMLPASYSLGGPELWHKIFTEKTAGFHLVLFYLFY